MDVDLAQAAHPQHIHLELPVDPVAIERADQIVDAVVDAVEPDATSPGSKPAFAAGLSGSICASSAPIVLSTPATTACRAGPARSAGNTDMSAADIAVTDDLRQHELRGVAGDRKTCGCPARR